MWHRETLLPKGTEVSELDCPGDTWDIGGLKLEGVKQWSLSGHFPSRSFVRSFVQQTPSLHLEGRTRLVFPTVMSAQGSHPDLTSTAGVSGGDGPSGRRKGRPVVAAVVMLLPGAQGCAQAGWHPAGFRTPLRQHRPPLGGDGSFFL